jgi:hypothetical protein
MTSVRNRMATTAILTLVVGVGCDGAHEPGAGALEDLDVSALTFDDVGPVFETISQQRQARPDDPIVRAAMQRLQTRLDELNHLVARVTTDSGHVVDFYEPSPGAIAFSESGPAGDLTRVLGDPETANLPVLDLYRRLAKQEPPQALIDASTRTPLTDQRPQTADLGEPVASSAIDGRATAGADGVEQAVSPLTAADGIWYRVHGNGCFSDSVDFNVCRPNWANGGFASTVTKTSFFNIAPFAGNGVLVRMNYSNEGHLFAIGVFNGEWRFFGARSSTYYDILQGGWDYVQRTHRYDILNATGDQFHWSAAFKWRCELHACDSEP